MPQNQAEKIKLEVLILQAKLQTICEDKAHDK
jgi:hypothetical protein